MHARADREVRLRILVTGATGLIGSAVVARLAADGAEIVAVSRGRLNVGPRSSRVRWIHVDMARAVDASDWLGPLDGVDAVVNCAGVLQDSPSDSTSAVHHRGAAALFEACERAGVRRVIQVSALGADRESLSAFSASKRAGDAALTARNLDWVLLRPAVVVGRAAYGGSALFRALAAWPVLPKAHDAGELQVVQLDEVVETVVRLIRPGAPSRIALELVGPERLSFEQTVAAYRRWLGWPAARVIDLPKPLMAIAFRLGDLVGLLGWRSPIRSTARRELARSATGDGGLWRSVTGIEPTPLAVALEGEPPSVQEHWFARLYLIKALILSVLALFWISTGLIALGPGYAGGEELLRQAGAGAFAGLGAIVGGFADIAIGLAIAWRRTARAGLRAALAVSLLYVAIATACLPSLWADPLGGIVKILPIIVLNIVALAILDDR